MSKTGSLSTFLMVLLFPLIVFSFELPFIKNYITPIKSYITSIPISIREEDLTINPYAFSASSQSKLSLEINEDVLPLGYANYSFLSNQHQLESPSLLETRLSNAETNQNVNDLPIGKIQRDRKSIYIIASHVSQLSVEEEKKYFLDFDGDELINYEIIHAPSGEVKDIHGKKLKDWLHQSMISIEKNHLYVLLTSQIERFVRTHAINTTNIDEAKRIFIKDNRIILDVDDDELLDVEAHITKLPLTQQKQILLNQYATEHNKSVRFIPSHTLGF